VQQVIDRHEADGTTGDEAHVEAAMAFFTRWLCRLPLPWPAQLMRSFENASEGVHGIMWGREWNVTGNVKDWDVTNRLSEPDLPVLVTSGRHDVITSTVLRPLVDGIRGAEWVVFEHSAHMPHLEEPERYRQVLAAFLARAEGHG